jgi:hypothetical protein
MKERITKLLAESPISFDLTPFAGWETWQDEAMLLDFGQRLKKATGK